MITPRYYQADAVKATFKALELDGCNPLVVMPTGSGKSIVIADLIKQCMAYSGTKIIMLTHVKELVEQNSAELSLFDIEHGIYSAGLRKKDSSQSVTCAGIQSIYKHARKFGIVDLIIVDEAHRVPQKAMGTYRLFINDLRKYNPNLRVIGLTATPYRLGSGLLIDGKDAIFNRIAYDIGVKELISKGYLAPLKSALGVRTARPDTSSVKKVAGEFNSKQLAEVTDVTALVEEAVADIMAHGKDRKKWLVFAVSVKHAENVTSEFLKHGISCAMVTGDTPADQRDNIILDYKNNDLKCLVNVNVFTTGFNVKDIDLLALLRATASASLYVQMLGRLMRIAAGKTDGLVLDYGGNIERFGPIDQIVVRRKADGVTEVTCTPQKECPECKVLCSVALRECLDCGYEFEINTAPKHGTHASNLDILSVPQKAEWFDVQRVTYQHHQSRKSKVPTLRVNYLVGMIEFSEWVPFEHDNARKIANKWWYLRSSEIAPTSVKEALAGVKTLRKPLRVMIIKNKDGFDEVKKVEF